MTTLSFGAWLSGFSDGEACFHLKALKRKGQSTYHFCTTFQILLRADDRGILEEIQKYLKCGTIRPYKLKGSDHGGFSVNPKVVFSVDTLRDNVAHILPQFDRFPLRSKKARDYVLYRRAVLLRVDVTKRKREVHVRGQGARQWSLADEQKFLELKHTLEEGRRYGT